MILFRWQRLQLMHSFQYWHMEGLFHHTVASQTHIGPNGSGK